MKIRHESENPPFHVKQLSSRYKVNSFSSQFTLILVNSYSFFDQIVLIKFFFGQFVLIWSIPTHSGQFVLILVSLFSH